MVHCLGAGYGSESEEEQEASEKSEQSDSEDEDLEDKIRWKRIEFEKKHREVMSQFEEEERQRVAAHKQKGNFILYALVDCKTGVGELKCKVCH